MAEEVQGHAAEESESSESSEATIAVHWREEGYYPPPPKFIGQANASDPAILDRFAEENFPECFKEYARPAALGPVLAHDAGHQQRAVLEVVCRRQAERQLQLRRPSPGKAQEQGGADLGARARGRPARRDHLPGALPPGERVRGAAAGLLRPGGRRPGHAAHADGARAAGHDAGLRPARGDPLPGVRRVQRRGLRAPHRRLEQQDPDHHGRLLPQRRRARPQGQGRRGGRGGPQGRHRGREGAGLAALPRPVLVRDADGGRPGLLRRRAPRRLPGTRSSRRSPCRPRRRCS